MINANLNINGARKSSPFPTAGLLFKSGIFDFESNVLTDVSGKGNDVSLVGGNCVNFINDVTITLSPAQVGATVTEVNFSETTTGVTINGSGHIEIVAASLFSTKIYQIKLSTDDEFILTNGSNNYVFCSSNLYGKLGGLENTDWEWSTQNDYFGNLQNGFSKGTPLFNLTPTDMTSWNKRNYTTPDSNTVVFQGGTYQYESYFDYRDFLTIGKTYRIKLVVWDSTENFGDHFRLVYHKTTGNDTLDDNGVLFSKNGTHYFTFTKSGAVNRISFNMNDADYDDRTGENLKFRVEWVKELDYNLIIPAFNSLLDKTGNELTNPAHVNRHNGSEVKLDFSNITGVTDREGNSLTLPSDYSFGDSLENPHFKRLLYNSNNKGQESDYMVYNSYQTDNSLSRIISYLESPNMLARQIGDQIVVVKKHDSTRDMIFVFDFVGYNLIESLRLVDVKDNSLELPIWHDDITPDRPNEGADGGFFGTNASDLIGPYSVNSIGWHGGTHLQPDESTPDLTWEAIIAVDDTLKTITVDDSSNFPDPPNGENQILRLYNWGGTNYVRQNWYYYTKSGNVISLLPIMPNDFVDLSGVIIGGDNPSQIAWTGTTANPEDIPQKIPENVITPIKKIDINVINSIIDSSTKSRITLDADELMQESVTYSLHQNSGTIFVQVKTIFSKQTTINSYYGLQGSVLWPNSSYPAQNIYFAHSNDTRIFAAATGLSSGDRNLYKCEKCIQRRTSGDKAPLYLSNFIDLEFGAPAESNWDDRDRFVTPAKLYFNMINQNVQFNIGDTLQWRGGYNFFRNETSDANIFAYFQTEGDNLFFIVDFTNSDGFPASFITTKIAGRKCQLIYKDDGITINGIAETSFTIPNTGFDLTATEDGNIKIKLM